MEEVSVEASNGIIRKPLYGTTDRLGSESYVPSMKGCISALGEQLSRVQGL